MNFFKKHKWAALSAVVLLLGSAAFTYTEEVNRQKEMLVTDYVVNALRIAHYDKLELDDEFSQQVFDLYLKRLDYTKKFLLAEDIDKLNKYRNLIDDQLKSRNAEVFRNLRSINRKTH
jgi:carboxyl-terminal processing protease